VPAGRLLAATGGAPEASGLGGLAGLAADAIAWLGEFGVGLSTFVETVLPPVPSEVVLPLAGYLAERGRLSLVGVIVAATIGGYLGALALYALGARMGEERAVEWLSRLPLLDRDDLERSVTWFHQHGRWSVLVGRLIPGIRSLVSLPAGAARMPLLWFSLLTCAGSLVWNSVLVGAGVALGTQYQLVERYSSVLNYLVYAALAAVVVWLVARRVRRRRGANV
jgi:membrane protein DedA with SNARE-associated domain